MAQALTPPQPGTPAQAPGSPLRVAVLSLAPRQPPEATLPIALRLVQRAAARQAQLVVLPETWPGPGPFDPGWQPLAREARRLGIWIAASLHEQSRGRLVNRLRLWGPGGQLAAYDKLYPYPPLEGGVTPGRRRMTASLGAWRLGLAICFDLNAPELFRAYADRGVELFVVCAAWPVEYGWLAEVYARARAAENQAYLALANRPGAPALVVAPDGQVLARRTREGVALADLSRERLEQYRQEFPLRRWQAGRRGSR